MLKQVRMINIQSHQDTVLDFPATGLIRFRGENSEGKSVFTKVLNETVQCKLHRKRNRLPLINRNCESGQFIVSTYRGMQLLVNIHRESSKTYYEFTDAQGNVLRRYLSDKDLPQLIEMFGFHNAREREFSLNVYNTYDPLLMLTTTLGTNFDVLNSAVTDPQAERAIEGINVTVDELEGHYKQAQTSIQHYESKLSVLQIWDKEAEAIRRDRLTYLGENIICLETPTLLDINPIPDLTTIELLDTTSIYTSMNNMLVVRDELDDILQNIDSVSLIGTCGITIVNNNITEYVNRYNELLEALDNEECPICRRGWQQYA